MHKRRHTPAAALAVLLVLPAAASAAPDAADDAPRPPTLATCGTVQEDQRPPWGHVFVSRSYPKQTLSPRARPAEVPKLSDTQMMQRGFVAIAWLEVTRFDAVKMNDKPVENVTGPGTALDIARDEAARLGGDAYTLFDPAAVVQESIDSIHPDGHREHLGYGGGTKVNGTVWRRAPSRSAAQLLVHAADRGQLAIVDRLLRAGVPVDSREPRYCQTALIAAATIGREAVVRRLIEAGARIELVDINGLTALGHAAFMRPYDRTCAAANVLRRAGAREPGRPKGEFSFDFPEPKRCPR